MSRTEFLVGETSKGPSILPLLREQLMSAHKEEIWYQSGGTVQTGTTCAIRRRSGPYDLTKKHEDPAFRPSCRRSLRQRMDSFLQTRANGLHHKLTGHHPRWSDLTRCPGDAAPRDGLQCQLATCLCALARRCGMRTLHNVEGPLDLALGVFVGAYARLAVHIDKGSGSHTLSTKLGQPLRQRKTYPLGSDMR